MKLSFLSKNAFMQVSKMENKMDFSLKNALKLGRMDK